MSGIKDFLIQFKWMFLITAVLFGVWLLLFTVRSDKEENDYTRTNEECDTTERVFDYGDKLTNEEEENLRALIAQREKQIGCDIVLVTLNEELFQDIRDYADDFYDNHIFGYNKPWGDGVVYVDNWYDGYVWLSTSGKAEDKYSANMINELIDDVTSVTNQNPYEAYARYVNDVYYQMSGKGLNGSFLTMPAVFILALFITGIYTVTGLYGTKTKRTVGITAYVPAGKPDMGFCNDVFLHTHTTRRHIESNSGGHGGGGHHISGGGHSHGGGGGRH